MPNQAYRKREKEGQDIFDLLTAKQVKEAKPKAKEKAKAETKQTKKQIDDTYDNIEVVAVVTRKEYEDAAGDLSKVLKCAPKDLFNTKQESSEEVSQVKETSFKTKQDINQASSAEPTQVEEIPVKNLEAASKPEEEEELQETPGTIPPREEIQTPQVEESSVKNSEAASKPEEEGELPEIPGNLPLQEEIQAPQVEEESSTSETIKKEPQILFANAKPKELSSWINKNKARLKIKKAAEDSNTSAVNLESKDNAEPLITIDLSEISTAQISEPLEKIQDKTSASKDAKPKEEKLPAKETKKEKKEKPAKTFIPNLDLSLDLGIELSGDAADARDSAPAVAQQELSASKAESQTASCNPNQEDGAAVSDAGEADVQTRSQQEQSASKAEEAKSKEKDDAVGLNIEIETSGLLAKAKEAETQESTTGLTKESKQDKESNPKAEANLLAMKPKGGSDVTNELMQEDSLPSENEIALDLPESKSDLLAEKPDASINLVNSPVINKDLPDEEILLAEKLQPEGESEPQVQVNEKNSEQPKTNELTKNHQERPLNFIASQDAQAKHEVSSQSEKKNPPQNLITPIGVITKIDEDIISDESEIVEASDSPYTEEIIGSFEYSPLNLSKAKENEDEESEYDYMVVKDPSIIEEEERLLELGRREASFAGREKYILLIALLLIILLLAGYFVISSSEIQSIDIIKGNRFTEGIEAIYRAVIDFLTGKNKQIF